MGVCYVTKMNINNVCDIGFLEIHSRQYLLSEKPIYKMLMLQKH